MTYSIEVAARAERELVRLPTEIQRSIVRAIQKLAVAPQAALNVKKLSGVEGYRLRVRDWRILFQLDHEHKVIVILAIGNRRDIYRRI